MTKTKVAPFYLGHAVYNYRNSIQFFFILKIFQKFELENKFCVARSLTSIIHVKYSKQSSYCCLISFAAMLI